MHRDVPSPIDLRQMSDARAWEASAMTKRPWRTEFFDRFAREIARSTSSPCRVLELGSGPGFLAECLLRALPTVEYVALDFSAAMHELARVRLGELASRVVFVERSFRESNWSHGLGSFGFVVTNQAVHELRHKRYAVALHARVQPLLAPGGVYLVCDHFAGEGGMSNAQLFMSIEEQETALLDAGFGTVQLLMVNGGLALFSAT